MKEEPRLFRRLRKVLQRQKEHHAVDTPVEQLGVNLPLSEGSATCVHQPTYKQPVSQPINEPPRTLAPSSTIHRTAKPPKWSNWSKNQSCRPSQTAHPETIQDVIDVVKYAKAENKKIRCVAGGYTWSSSSVVQEDGILVFVDKMTKIFPPMFVEGQGWTVEMETGVTVNALDEYLRRHDPPLTMTANVVMGEVCFGGVLALGSHGAATQSRTLSDLACEVKIVDANGTLNTFTRDKDPVEFSAAACNLGLLGVIYCYTLRVELMFNLSVSDSYPRLVDYFSCPKQGGARLKDMAAQNDQIQILFWVFDGHYSRTGDRLGTGREKDHVWVKQWRRTDQPVTGSTLWKSIRTVRQYTASFMGVILFNTMAAIPRMTPLINCVVSKASRTGFEKVLEAPDAIHYQHNIDDMVCVGVEYVFKVDEGFERPSKAWRFAIDKIYEYAAQGKYPVNMIMDMRFIKSSDQILSYVYDKDPEAIYCTIEILTASRTKGFEEFTAMVAQHWMSEYQARPHWAKLWEHIPGIVPYLREQARPQLDLFESIRKKYDPEGMFLNKTFAGVLGHK